jgi:ribosomal protein L7Ae-like RNA K-turn-binding protein
MNKTLSLIGIAKKAGLLEIGGDAVSAAARGRKARLIHSASDASEASKRRAGAAAAAGGIAYAALGASKLELARVIGRGLPGTIAITDAGLAFGVASRLSERDPEKYAALAEALRENAARELTRRRARTARKRGGKSGRGACGKACGADCAACGQSPPKTLNRIPSETLNRTMTPGQGG